MECIVSQQSAEMSNQNYAPTSLCQEKEHPLPSGYTNPRGGLRQQKRQQSFPHQKSNSNCPGLVTILSVLFKLSQHWH